MGFDPVKNPSNGFWPILKWECVLVAEVPPPGAILLTGLGGPNCVDHHGGQLWLPGRPSGLGNPWRGALDLLLPAAHHHIHQKCPIT